VESQEEKCEVQNRKIAMESKKLIIRKAVFENMYFMFFSDFKKHDFLPFFEMMYQKVVKSR